MACSAVSVMPGDLFLISPGELHDSSGLGHANRWIVAFGADALDPGRTGADIFLGLPDELLLLAFLRPQGARTGDFQAPPGDRSRRLTRLGQLVAELDRFCHSCERSSLVPPGRPLDTECGRDIHHPYLLTKHTTLPAKLPSQ